MAGHQRTQESPTSRDTQTGPGILRVGFLVLAGVYAVAFVAGTPMRRAALLGLLLPDSLVREWFGGDLARFGLGDRVSLLLIAGVIFAVALLAGQLILGAAGADRVLDRGERLILGVGVGMNTLSLVTLAMGLAGQLSSGWWFYLLAAVVAAMWGWRLWRRYQRSTEALPESPGSGEGGQHALEALPRWVIWLAVPLILACVLGGMLPPWHFDVREYHLQVPKEWFLQGSIGFMPHNVYGNMPLGAENHALLAMVLMWGPDRWWWGALAGKTIVALFGPLTALAVYLCGRHWVGGRAAAFGSLIFLATPWVGYVSAAGLNDAVTAFYYLTAGHAFLRWAHLARPESGAGTARPPTAWGLLLISGFLAGSAVACKYPSLLFLATPMVLACFVARRGRDRWLAPLVLILGMLAGCGLWLGKNWVLSGNPTYPLLYEWFDGKTRTPEKNAQWTRAHRTARDATGHRFSGHQFRDSAWKLTWASTYSGPLLIPFFAWGIFAQRRNRRLWPLPAFCVYVVACWWLTTHRIDRFLLPVLPVAALLAGAGCAAMNDRFWRRGVAALLVGGVAFCLLITTSRFAGDNRYFVALADLRQDIPTEKDSGNTYTHIAHRFLNNTVEDGFAVLVVGEAQVFDLKMPVIYNTCFDDCQFERLMRGRTRAERYAALRALKISHIFFFWRELDRYRSPGNYGYSDYVTRQRVHRELVAEQGLLRPVPLDVPPENSEVFEVVNWRDWR